MLGECSDEALVFSSAFSFPPRRYTDCFTLYKVGETGGKGPQRGKQYGKQWGGGSNFSELGGRNCGPLYTLTVREVRSALIIYSTCNNECTTPNPYVRSSLSAQCLSGTPPCRVVAPAYAQRPHSPTESPIQTAHSLQTLLASCYPVLPCFAAAASCCSTSCCAWYSSHRLFCSTYSCCFLS